MKTQLLKIIKQNIMEFKIPTFDTICTIIILENNIYYMLFSN